MYEFMNNIFKDHDTGVFTFKPFGLCHIIYLVLIIAAITAVILIFKNKSQDSKTKLINFTVGLALGLYILDFFIMPFSEGEINIDKLPFHVCTSMSIMCLLSRKTKFFAKFKTAFSLMGLLGALMYIAYPSGVAEADGYSYRIVQTVIYHGLMIAQGVFSLVFNDLDLDYKKMPYDLIAIASLAIIAFVANHLYSGTLGDYSESFNWFFVKHDALYIIPDDIDIYFVPYAMVAVVFGLCALTRVFTIWLKNLLRSKNNKVNE